VTILDNGPGIPASVRRTLFDPFVTAGKPNGTGLGLTLARRIAEEHGGGVSLEVSNPGRTVFALSLTKNGPRP
ncbi:MAG: ATP-binding protein, partial [Acidobacteriaceae bacterium]